MTLVPPGCSSAGEDVRNCREVTGAAHWGCTTGRRVSTSKWLIVCRVNFTSAETEKGEGRWRRGGRVLGEVGGRRPDMGFLGLKGSVTIVSLK